MAYAPHPLRAMHQKVDSTVTRRRREEIADPSRRSLLRGAGLLGAAVAGTSVTGPAAAQSPAENVIPVREALENLTALEAATLEAATARILPSDENGPGAFEARAVHYIDRCLGAHLRDSGPAYAAGLSALHEHAIQRHGTAFSDLDLTQQDALLTAMEAGELDGFAPDPATFFELLRDHTMEGTFSDPYYGGNRGFVGWDLLGYPGIRLGTTPQEVAQGRNLPANHRSAFDNAVFTKTGNRGP